MRCSVLALVVVAAVCLSPAAASIDLPKGVLRGPQLRELFGAPPLKPPSNGDLWPNIESWLVQAGRKTLAAAKHYLGLEEHFDPMEPFAWIPVFVGAAPSSGKPLVLSTPCFDHNSWTMGWLDKGGAFLQLSASQPKNCAEKGDFYLVGTIEGIHFMHINESAAYHFNWEADFTKAERDWVMRNGMRIFRFNGSPELVLQQLVSTVGLFLEPLTQAEVGPVAAMRNREFLKIQAFNDMDERPIEDVPIAAEDIQDGDFFGVIRLDGLDPMLAWAMGAHTGHTTIALRFDGELWVCESTTASAYWPTPHVQRTPYDTWIKQAKHASYNVVHLPLTDAARAKFNSTAAQEWFLNVADGQPYGFNNLLFGWVDTVEDNYPGNLTSAAHEILVSIVEHVSDYLADGIWSQPLNKRLGTSGLNYSEVLYTAAQRNLTFGEVFQLPEQDAWRYSGNLSMVCDVMVCEMYMAAGLFGNMTDKFQCTEFTNWDVYSLNIFNNTRTRPTACQVADPDLPYCQILGKYRVTLPGYATRPTLPHMAENCPRGLPPQYNKPNGC